MDILVYLTTALIPLVIGFIWYHPKVFGNIWMRLNGFTPDNMKKGNMPIMFGATYLFSLMMSLLITALVIHQAHLQSIVMNEEGLGKSGSEVQQLLDTFILKYGNNFRTFKHGMFHGAMAAIFFALPLVGINALFERRGFKYIFLHAGYWFISIMLMGGVLCQWIKLG
jgi:hypothetical protein